MTAATRWGATASSAPSPQITQTSSGQSSPWSAQSIRSNAASHPEHHMRHIVDRGCDRNGDLGPAVGSTAMSEPIVVDVGKARITLDQLGLTQPGMARLMAELGPRMHRLYYAAEAGNWPLAAYFLRESQSLLRISMVVRPKYTEAMEAFLAEDLAPVADAVHDRDWPTFDRAFAAMVDRANRYHEEFGKPYIVWKTPDAPPPDLDLTPRPPR